MGEGRDRWRSQLLTHRYTYLPDIVIGRKLVQFAVEGYAMHIIIIIFKIYIYCFSIKNKNMVLFFNNKKSSQRIQEGNRFGDR